ncbi:MAG: hypothetical protein ACRDM1_00475, partial [Gaiellaceae bacterium]
MPSRKQRRRRQKSFRHEYGYVVVDEEGNEVPLDPQELRAEREAKEKERSTNRPARTGRQGPAAKDRRGRTVRPVPPPTWERALRRGGIMGVLMLVAFVFVFKSSPLPIRLAWGIFYAVAYVPLTYWIDRTAHRSYLRRIEKQSGKSGA